MLVFQSRSRRGIMSKNAVLRYCNMYRAAQHYTRTTGKPCLFRNNALYILMHKSFVVKDGSAMRNNEHNEILWPWDARKRNLL